MTFPTACRASEYGSMWILDVVCHSYLVLYLVMQSIKWKVFKD